MNTDKKDSEYKELFKAIFKEEMLKRTGLNEKEGSILFEIARKKTEAILAERQQKKREEEK